jgi:hypothetical protein
MTRYLLSRNSLIWALLVAATVVSWALGHGLGTEGTPLAGAAILVVTFIKVRFVMLDFMELRHAPVWMRITAQSWMVLVCGLLVTLFILGPQLAA